MALLEKSMRDCSKLIPKMIIDKNGHARKVYVKLGLPVKPAEGGKVEKQTVPVQHDGEYVLTSAGSRDFGEISPEIAGQIRRQAGKIRLRVGKHEGKTGDYGEKHIERPERLRQLIENGYQNARDLVQDVTTSFDAIFKGDGPRLILSKRGTVTDITIFVELIPATDGDFYDVKTGLISRRNYFKKKTPLWTKPKSGV
jgi:hypothetical protein